MCAARGFRLGSGWAATFKDSSYIGPIICNLKVKNDPIITEIEFNINSTRIQYGIVNVVILLFQPVKRNGGQQAQNKKKSLKTRNLMLLGAHKVFYVRTNNSHSEKRNHVISSLR